MINGNAVARVGSKLAYGYAFEIRRSVIVIIAVAVAIVMPG
jgi:hypothetical protein